MVTDKHKKRMFTLCDLVKTWSECPEGRQHACILTIDGKWVVSTGFNGMLEGTCTIGKDCVSLSGLEMRKVCEAIHAESNAIKNCPIPTKGLIAYVSKKPCDNCFNLLYDFGITQVYWREEIYQEGAYDFTQKSSSRL